VRHDILFPKATYSMQFKLCCTIDNS